MVTQQDMWAVIGLTGSAITVSNYVIQWLKLEAEKDKRLVVLGVTAALAVLAKLTQTFFADLNWLAMAILILAATGAANNVYRYAVQPIAAGMAKLPVLLKAAGGFYQFVADLFNKVLRRNK